MQDKIKIQLTQNKSALIDKKDYLTVSKFKWHYKKSGRTKGLNGYAAHMINKADLILHKNVLKGKKVRDSLFMHNLIARPKKGRQVDHVDRDGLNNTRKNLRTVTISQNMHNFPNRNPKSGYKGVYFHKKGITARPWECSMTIKGKQRSLGVFGTAEEAALAYNNKARELYGNAAILNIISK